MPHRPAAVALCLCLGLLGAAPSLAQRSMPDALVEADRALREGAADEARFFLDQYHADPLPGFDALALFVEALTEATEGTEGDRDRVPCLWGEAVLRNDYFRDVDLTPYPAGGRLARWTGLEGPVAEEAATDPVPDDLAKAPIHALELLGRWDGKVFLDAVVDPEGRVFVHDVGDSVPAPVALAAVRAVCPLRYRPATDGDGRPVAVRLELRIRPREARDAAVRAETLPPDDSPTGRLAASAAEALAALDDISLHGATVADARTVARAFVRRSQAETELDRPGDAAWSCHAAWLLVEGWTEQPGIEGCEDRVRADPSGAAVPARLVRPLVTAYPEHLHRRNVRGDVVLDLEVTDDGGVRTPRLVSRSPVDPGLLHVALETARRARVELGPGAHAPGDRVRLELEIPTLTYDLAAVPLPPELEAPRRAILEGDPAGAAERLDDLRGAALTPRLRSITSALRALADVSRGEIRQANCHWAQALLFDPRLARVDLAPWPAGDSLERLPYPGRAPIEEIFETTDERFDVQPPKKVFAPDPEYPESARRAREQGLVVIQTVIDTDGQIYAPRVLRTTVGPELSARSVASLCRWRFEPASLDGEPVPVYYNLTVNFRIE